AAVKAFAKEHGYNEIYLMGNSYGGYLSLKMIVDHPNEFEGAFSINGVTDWDVLTANLRTSIFNVHFGGIKNGTNDALYEKASILANIDDLSKKDKIYIAHGDKDMTVPYAQSKLLADALKKEKLKPTFITFKGEDHVYMKEKTFISLCKNVFKFVGEKGKCSI
ncbi:S9 family peptidase, partial [Patescibacteria group bacterium]|nr:S9 family peptidase [Patescibacteria group bacterium]MBU1754732.1 S9 family peptidase [Patescibacteria group bacterium]